MRRAVICQVKDQPELVPYFIGAHHHLFDHIVMIDHNSSVDLRAIELEKVTVVRVEVRPYLQQVYPNFVIRRLQLQNKFDYIFALDIDEFLLIDECRLTNVLQDNRRNAYIKLYWRNGILEFQDHEVGVTARRCLWGSSTRKVAVNTSKIRDFNFLHGYHSIWYSSKYKLNPFIGGGVATDIPLTHFPLGIGRDFMTKVGHQSFPDGTFWSKITRGMPDHYIDACRRVACGGDDINDRFMIAAFYRSASETIPPPFVDGDMFERVDLSEYLNSDVVDLTHAAILNAFENSGKSTLDSTLLPQERKLVELARRQKKFTVEMEGLLHYDVELGKICVAGK